VDTYNRSNKILCFRHFRMKEKAFQKLGLQIKLQKTEKATKIWRQFSITSQKAQKE